MERDYAYEKLAETTGTDMTVGRGELNAALKSIRQQSDRTGEDLAREIADRVRVYRQIMPAVILTPSALAKHWRRCETTPNTATNRSTTITTCRTCGGDRFVVYQLRAPQQSSWMHERGIVPTGSPEETVCCPDCNSAADASYWLHGRKMTPPDPAQVRERLNL